MLKNKIALFVILILSLAIFSSVTVAQTTYTIEGHVTYDDGSGVAGVEVFLGVQDTVFEARYTCTDADGYYSFEEVPDVPLISAVGPDVDTAEICASPYFTDASNNPIVIQFYSGGATQADMMPFSVSDSPINYTVELWDTGGNRAIRNLIVGAHRLHSEDFSSGDNSRFHRRMDLIIAIAGRFQDRGRISAATESSIVDNATNYLTIGR